MSERVEFEQKKPNLLKFKGIRELDNTRKFQLANGVTAFASIAIVGGMTGVALATFDAIQIAAAEGYRRYKNGDN